MKIKIRKERHNCIVCKKKISYNISSEDASIWFKTPSGAKVRIYILAEGLLEMNVNGKKYSIEEIGVKYPLQLLH